MNRVILVGRLTKSPDVKNTTTGKAVANFTLAVDRRFKNKDGQKEADFINCQAWGKTAEIIGQYTAKGSQAGIVGRLQVRSYDGTDGQRKWVTEVIVDEFNFIGTGKKSDGQQNQGQGVSVTDIDADFSLMADDDDFPW